MANIFNINWSTVVESITPYFWRETFDGNEGKIIAYFRSMVAPVQDISDNLLALQEDTIDFLNYNGQHKVLEEFLNDKYDFTLRRITIDENDIAAIDPISIYQSGETTGAPLELYLSGESPPAPIAIYQSNEVVIGDNFTINIPAAVVYDPDTLNAQLKNYVEASKNYNIVIF